MKYTPALLLLAACVAEPSSGPTLDVRYADGRHATYDMTTAMSPARAGLDRPVAPADTAGLWVVEGRNQITLYRYASPIATLYADGSFRTRDFTATPHDGTGHAARFNMEATGEQLPCGLWATAILVGLAALPEGCATAVTCGSTITSLALLIREARGDCPQMFAAHDGVHHNPFDPYARPQPPTQPVEPWRFR